MDLNAIGSHQTHRGHVTGSSGIESRRRVRVFSALRGAHSPYHTCFPEHEVSDHRGSNSQPIDFEGVEIYPIFVAKIENTEKSST
jgi:hypothetical protein